MKRLYILLALTLIVFTAPLSAQLTTYDEFSAGFVDFAESIADELPFNTTVGLNWADAYIGTLPHFGIGVTIGATLVPFGTLDEAMKPLGVDLEAELGDELGGLGFPLPGAVLDARIGGIVLPFDLGFKIGYLPQEAKVFLPGNMSLDYLLIGGDIRYAIVQEKGWLPDVSIGVGYNYLKGNIAISGIMGGDQDIADVETGTGTVTLRLQDPDVYLNWEASTIDLKVQVSKTLLVFTPFVGVGAAYGESTSGGGLKTNVLVNWPGPGFTPITDDQIKQIKDYYELIGEPVPDLSASGLIVNSDAKGWAYRVFGGISLNVFLLRINLNGMYNITTGAVGASINGAIQF
jgi:hypothetical protein